MGKNKRKIEQKMADLELRIGYLKRENRSLKKQLKIRQVCEKCDYLTEKCKRYIGKVSLLYDYKREISKLQDKITNLEAQIAENDSHYSHHVNGRSNNAVTQNNSDISSYSLQINQCTSNAVTQNIPEVNGNCSFYLPEQRQMKQEFDDNTSLYEQCRKVVEEEDLANELEELVTVESDSKDSDDCNGDEETPVCKWVLCGEGNVEKKKKKICDKVCRSIADLLSHVNECHVVPGPGGYVCLWEGCKRKGTPWKRKSLFEIHFRRHSRERPFACPYEGCDKTYRGRSALREHGYTHRPQNFMCVAPGCYKVYQSKQIMMQHYREKHEGRPQFKCPVAGCGRFAVSRFKLQRHMHVHERRRAKELGVL